MARNVFVSGPGLSWLHGKRLLHAPADPHSSLLVISTPPTPAPTTPLQTSVLISTWKSPQAHYYRRGSPGPPVHGPCLSRKGWRNSFRGGERMGAFFPSRHPGVKGGDKTREELIKGEEGRKKVEQGRWEGKWGTAKGAGGYDREKIWQREEVFFFFYCYLCSVSSSAGSQCH